MNKKLILIGVLSLIVGAIISPVIGMGIGQTRSLILGLAPEESVLKLADQIDTNRNDVDNKLGELQSLIDAQKKQIDDQNLIIESQNSELNNTKEDIAKQKSDIVTVTTKATQASDSSTKAAECNKLLQNKWANQCDYPDYKSKSAYDKFYATLKDKNDKEVAQEIFSVCDSIRAKCN